jgi:alkanesulfonate monooxygenase SsuD/methylene tetrahydromethanopterin reductase-like flavin-dependent oxidoreductase (luciferase family)
MPDYGHPLRFATFIAPTNSPAHRSVELAQLSERLGFDSVTFQVPDTPMRSVRAATQLSRVQVSRKLDW